jgi:hypothetical protein
MCFISCAVLSLADVHIAATTVGWCRLKCVETRLESSWFQLWKIYYDKMLPSFAFNFSLRPNTTAYPFMIGAW